MRLIHATIMILLLSWSGIASSDVIAINPDAPERYVVVAGDTLWSISARFLRDPWRWPDVWDFNPQIQNPHLIYPGDIIVLSYQEGKPVLRRLDRVVETSGDDRQNLTSPGEESLRSPQAPTSPEGEIAPPPPGESEAPPKRVRKIISAANTGKLLPRIRATQKDRAIPTIPMEIIEQFLSKPLVISEKELKNSGYVVSGEDKHLISGSGDIIYARNLDAGKTNRYSLYRTGRIYRNPGADEDDILGFEAIYVGATVVRSFGDPATLQITDSERETLLGDKLLPILDSDLNPNFLPHAPATPVEGQIIEVLDAVSRIGLYQTAVLNLGEFDGMETGHVLAVYRKGEVIRDVISPNPKDTVRLPDTRSGLLMIFKTFDRVSFGLIMDTEKDIQLYDVVRNP